MPHRKIASEPAVGWQGQRKPYSQVALQWLKSLPNIADIRHPCNGGEVMVNGVGGCKIYVDGMDETRSEVYEFYGCFYHGCRRCHPNH